MLYNNFVVLFYCNLVEMPQNKKYYRILQKIYYMEKEKQASLSLVEQQKRRSEIMSKEKKRSAEDNMRKQHDIDPHGRKKPGTSVKRYIF